MSMGWMFIVLAIAVMIGFLYEPIIKKRRCTQEVVATIDEIVEGNLVVNGEPKYSAICKYYYQGVEYREKVQMNINRYDLKIGNTKNIYINPLKPKENYIYNRSTAQINALVVVICSIFIIAGAYVVYEDVQGNWVEISPGHYVLKDSNNAESENQINFGTIDTGQNPHAEKLEGVVGGQSSADQGKEGQTSEGIADGSTQSPTEQAITDAIENADTTNKVTIHKVNIFKIDKNTTQMIRKSPYYLPIYKDIQSDPQYKQYGSDMTSVDVKGNNNYIASSQVDRTIKDVIMYLPKDLKFVQKIGYNYYYQSSITKSWLRVFISSHNGNDVYARHMLNDIANYNKIMDNINVPIVYNNNAYVTFGARNANGDYLNVACSVNGKYMLYIEYNHKLGTKNNFNEMLSTIKY